MSFLYKLFYKAFLYDLYIYLNVYIYISKFISDYSCVLLKTITKKSYKQFY